MKPGTKLKSAVCDAEVMVIKAGAGGVLCCGGSPMVAERSGERGPIDPAFADGAKMGKRYEDAAATVEILCIKPGAGSLSIDGTALTIKEAKPLPSSD